MFDLLSLEGRNRVEQINTLCDYLEKKCGIKPVITKSSGGIKSAYLVRDGVVLAIVHKPASEDLDFVLMDRHLYDKFIADGKGSLNLVKRDGKPDYKVMISRDGGKLTLHREAVKLKCGHDIDDLQVDHITHNVLINTFDMLRACTNDQNAKNRLRSRDISSNLNGDVLATDYKADFSYNPVLDFTDTWYAFVLYKMGELSGADLCDYNRDYRIRHDIPVAA